MDDITTIRSMYRLTPTQWDRVYVGAALTGAANSPPALRRTIPGSWRIIVIDDEGTAFPTGTPYRTKTDALIGTRLDLDPAWHTPLPTDAA
ncbi:MAG: hypothetical protein ABI729_04200 [Chitinophagales bacterium]